MDSSRSSPGTERQRTPVLLTAFIVGLSAVFSALYGWPAVALCVGAASLPLLLIWLSRDVPAPLDRIAAVDAAHAKLSTA